MILCLYRNTNKNIQNQMMSIKLHTDVYNKLLEVLSDV